MATGLVAAREARRISECNIFEVLLGGESGTYDVADADYGAGNDNVGRMRRRLDDEASGAAQAPAAVAVAASASASEQLFLPRRLQDGNGTETETEAAETEAPTPAPTSLFSDAPTPAPTPLFSFSPPATDRRYIITVSWSLDFESCDL